MTPLLVLVLLVVCGVNSEIQVKHLAGPPSEFKHFAPLNPAHFPEVQHSATFQVDLEPDKLKASNVLSQQVTLTVDSKHEFRFFWFSPYGEEITVSLEDPEGNPVSLRALSTFVPIGDIHIPGTAYIIKRPIVGDYILTLTTNSLNQSLYHALSTNTNEDVYIVLWNEDELAMQTTLNTYDHVTGNKVGLVTRIVDTSFSNTGNGLQAYKDGHIIDAEMSVTLPNGRVVEKEMHDDGLHADEESDDDVFGALITANVPGTYIFSATINGTNADGDHYVRTTQKVIEVIEDTLSLTGSAVAYLDPSFTRLNINIGVHAHLGDQFYAYSEVWGMDESDEHVPIAWIGGMAFVQEDSHSGGKALSLELDFNWISMANAKGPLTLRHVVVKDPGVFVNVDEAKKIHVKTAVEIEAVMSKMTLLRRGDQITQEMREGRLPIANANVTAANGALVLVHGYCSGANPWQSSPAGTWTNPKYYLNANQNTLNDAFAKSILNFAGTSPYSCIGHSQGGMAITHLKQFYVSGMDYVSNGKVLQSVGTPYKGCSAAGTAANLGSLFGISCGANVDLTTDGAGRWLNTINPANRAKVSFYTTTYEQGKTFGDWCNLPMNSILQYPNDGTTEYDYAQLPGGNFMGNVQKWCHIDGMKYPNQCTDLSRNRAMNANAAR